MSLTSSALAIGPIETPETWGGDLASRERLSGDWGGVRDDMAKKGVVLDANMKLVFRGTATGTVGDPESNAAKIKEAVEKIVADYPRSEAVVKVKTLPSPAGRRLG